MFVKIKEVKEKLTKLLITVFDLKINRVVKEKEEMKSIKVVNDHPEVTEMNDRHGTGKMSDREVKELKNRVRAMSPEELAIVADTIPVELCLARIHNEIDRAKAMEDKIRDMIGSLGK